MTKLLVLVGSILVSSYRTPDHAIYISVIEVEISETAEFTLKLKVFTDDLENALRNFSSKYQVASSATLVAQNQGIAESYFDKHLSIELDDKRASLKLTSFKEENDAYFLFFNLEEKAKWEKINVEADYFMELFPDQSNILNLTCFGEKRFARLTKSSPSYQTTFY